MKDIIICNKDNVKITALVEDTKLVELYEEENGKKLLDGNIYCGIVRNILPGMQSAFVDIGERKNAFLHIRDVIPRVSELTGNKGEKMSKYNINDYIKDKMPILVQAKKEEEHQKGAKISTSINLPGRYTILIPNGKFLTISQKITNKKEIIRLKDIVSEKIKDLKEDNAGIILRTNAEGISKGEIESDISKVINLWHNILREFEEVKNLKKPTLIYSAPTTEQKIIIGTAKSNETEIIVDTKEDYENVKALLDGFEIENVKVENSSKDVLEKFDLKQQIESAKNRKIWLKCGGFITIDKTEALTAIDVNSGKFVGDKKNDQDQTIFVVNKEATIEIARQLRLKNVSGIIIIDYIDMEKDSEREELIKLLEKELKKDRSKTQIMGFTKLDLLEMTRKRI